jgi:hypothetical protein
MPSAKPEEAASPAPPPASPLPALGAASLELSFLTSVFAEISGLPHPATRSGASPGGRATTARDSVCPRPPVRK